MYYLCYSSTWCSSVTWKYLTWRRSSWEVRKRYKAPSAGFRGWQVCSRRARSTVTRWSWWRSRGAAFRTRHPRLWCVLLALRASRSTTDDGPTPTSLIGIRLSFDTCTSQIGVLLFCFFRLIYCMPVASGVQLRACPARRQTIVSMVFPGLFPPLNNLTRMSTMLSTPLGMTYSRHSTWRF